jgi:four helix bundle protein
VGLKIMCRREMPCTRSNYNQYKDFTSLLAWKKVREVKKFFYKSILSNVHIEEKLSLGFQIRKALISTSANIAEGYGRYHHKEAIQYYRITRASLYELKDHLISCFDFNYIDRTTLKIGIYRIETAKRILNGYISYIQHELNKSKK